MRFLGLMTAILASVFMSAPAQAGCTNARGFLPEGQTRCGGFGDASPVTVTISMERKSSWQSALRPVSLSTTLYSGDKVRLTIDAPSGYINIVNLGTSGEAAILNPNIDHDGGELVRTYDISGPAGTDYLLFFVSRDPITTEEMNANLRALGTYLSFSELSDFTGWDQLTGSTFRGSMTRSWTPGNMKSVTELHTADLSGVAMSFAAFSNGG